MRNLVRLFSMHDDTTNQTASCDEKNPAIEQMFLPENESVGHSNSLKWVTTF